MAAGRRKDLEQMHDQRIEEALATVDCFASVGVKRFSLTATDLAGKKVDRGYWGNRNLGAMRLLLPHLVPRCWHLRQSLIVRPLAPAGVTLAQLDDIDAQKRAAIEPGSFLVTETSPGNFQIWIAIIDAPADLVRRLVKGIGADCSASRAGRLPGSPNCKVKYGPNYPAVRAFLLQPGRVVAPADLEKFLAPPVQFPWPRSYSGTKSRGWPAYESVLHRAPRKKDGRPDRSKADFFWSKLAIERGNDLQAVVAKLAEVSERAQAEIRRGNPKYLTITVENASRGARS
jgi:hypothetical protein